MAKFLGIKVIAKISTNLIVLSREKAFSGTLILILCITIILIKALLSAEIHESVHAGGVCCALFDIDQVANR